MAGINRVILVGNLGKDPETRYTQDGKAITNITLATSESWKDKNTGQQQERTEWHRVVFFGGIAEIAGKYLKKGSKVYIEGKLQTRDYEKDGVKRYVTDVVVDGFSGTMQMLDSRSDQQDQNAPHGQPTQQPAQNAPVGGPPGDEFDDDICF